MRIGEELILSRRTDQFTAAVETLRRRSGRGIARARHRCRARSARRRRESAGSPGILFSSRLQGAHHPVLTSINWWNRALIGARWLLRKDGLGATNHFETCGFIRSRAGRRPIRTSSITSCPWPWRTTARPSRRSTAFKRMSGRCARRAAAGCAWPRRNPLDKPRILFNYLSEPDDWTEMRACVRLTREIFAQPAFDRYRGREIQPGAEVQTDEQIDAFIRGQGRERLPPVVLLQDGRPRTIPTAVVDPETRVCGLKGCGSWIPPSCRR